MFLVLDVVFVLEVDVWPCVEAGGITVSGLKNIDWSLVLVLFLFLGISSCKSLSGSAIKAEISVWACLVPSTVPLQNKKFINELFNTQYKKTNFVPLWQGIH